MTEMTDPDVGGYDRMAAHPDVDRMLPGLQVDVNIPGDSTTTSRESYWSWLTLQLPVTLSCACPFQPNSFNQALT